ncbi:hypothetical protein FHS96_001983 [Sphingomonas zeicaulis]|uniref:HEAT repeat domain-containing protein n=1 Tax=Sphingomonas zeicaulis TaxID=1632740 RepID=UPI003D1E665E
MAASTQPAIFDDRVALLQARERAADFSRAWRRRDDVGAIEARLEAAAASGGAAVQDVLVALFDEGGASGGWLRPMLGALVGGLRADPLFAPPLLALGDEIQRGLLLIQTPAASIAVARISAAALARRDDDASRAVVLSGALGALHIVEPGGARLRWWRAEATGAGFSQAAPTCLQNMGLMPLSAGQTVRVDGRTQGYTIEPPARDMLVLRAAVHLDRAPFQREYGTVDGRLIAASETRDEASRMRMLLTMLRSIGCSTANAAFEAALDEPEFELRWHAMREWLVIDPEAALPRLAQLAANDPHPEVRAAASSTLGRIKRRRAA